MYVWERLLPIVFRQKWNEIIKQLLNTINLGRRVISILTPWADHLSISAHKSQRQFAKELASDLAFLQSLTPRQHCSQLLYLSHCSGVKATKSLHRKRQEDETLVAASFSCVPDFSLVGLRERRSSICGGTSKIECFIILKRRSVADISAFCWKFSSADLLLCSFSRCKPLKIPTKCFLQIMIIIMCFLIDLPIFSEFHRIYSSTCPVAAAAIFRWAANKEKQFDVIDQCDWWKAQISRNS